MQLSTDPAHRQASRPKVIAKGDPQTAPKASFFFLKKDCGSSGERLGGSLEVIGARMANA